MIGGARRRATTVALAAVGALLLAGCGAVDGTGTAGEGAVSSNVPASQLKIIGDGNTQFDVLARNALTDIQQFWTKVFPTVSGGRQFQPLRGGVYSVTTGNPNTANACMEKEPKAADNNAFYCPLDDSFAYDRAGLVGQLATTHFGREMAMVILAHEFGHLIQNRLNIDRASILMESQADCAAGAFAAAEFGASSPTIVDPHFRESPPDLDRTIIGLILLRDPSPHNSTEQGTHGTGFDRGSAFADGFENGPKFCYSDDWTSRQFTERPYTTDKDYAAGGNEPEADVLSDTGGLRPDLNAYWAQAFSSIAPGKTWKDVQVKQADHPPCDDNSVQFGYCGSDNTIYYSTAIAGQAYNSVPDLHIGADGQLQFSDTAPGDYALGTLFTIGFGFAAMKQAGKGIDDTAALQRAVCYAGSYSQNINVETPPRKFSLSPQDMDEATYAVLRTINEPSVFGARNTTGLSRINSFRKGYLAKGPGGC